MSFIWITFIVITILKMHNYEEANIKIYIRNVIFGLKKAK